MECEERRGEEGEEGEVGSILSSPEEGAGVPLYLSIRARGVVDQSVLQEGSEDEKYADSGPDVDSLGVGHWGQGVVD